MSTASVSSALPPSSASPPPATLSIHRHFLPRNNRVLFSSKTFTTSAHNPFTLRVTNDSSRQTEVSSERRIERSDGDKIVDGMDFGELCNEFECISSPLVESTARQLVRDILELRQANRSFGTFAVSVKYKDPVRSFTGREKYKRSLWATDALENPTVTVQEMAMQSTSVLSIKWTVKGKPRSFIAGITGDLTVKVHSIFTLNQISGQVIEHEEVWDLSNSSAINRAFFWTSRRLFATTEAARDVNDLIKNMTSRTSAGKENMEISTDPTKFFQRDDSFQSDAYQIALFLAIMYFVVQFLKATL